MEQLTSGTSMVYLDFIISGFYGEPLIVSYYDRSQQSVRGFGASLIANKSFSYRYRTRKNELGFSSSFTPVVKGKEKFYHGMSVAEDLEKNYLVTTESELYKDLYYLLMDKYNLPLLEWWMPEVFKELVDKRQLSAVTGYNISGNEYRTIAKGGKEIPLKELLFFRNFVTEEELGKVISRLMKRGRIWITKTEQKKLVIDNLDSYFQQYGSTIVDNLKKILHPVSELNGKIDRAVLKTMRLYPQQAAMVNGACEYLMRKKGDYILFAMGMGSGKTIQAATAAEMLHVGKWLKEHPDKTLADAYEKDGVINYRHFIMCPGHLTEKWYKELKREIPYAKPVIVNSFKQLVELKSGGAERNGGKEFYIASKDFLKLSYQRIPVVRKDGVRHIEVFKCKDCGMLHTAKKDECVGCKGRNIVPVKTKYKSRGLICPHCNRLLVPENAKIELESLQGMDYRIGLPMKWTHMTEEHSYNQRCIYCGEALWQPYVKNINTELGFYKERTWYRQTFWANKSRKGKKTLWVMRGKEKEAEVLYGEVLNSMEDMEGGCRKYAPSLFIKKYLKGFFDVFICDEVHKAKGGGTAQGSAFHHIRKASKYTFGLTGTIAGGYATDLFYLLYRFEPGRMKAHGYEWNSVMQFAKDYGCVETEYYVTENTRRNTCSRGNQKSAPRVIPGISPLIFSEFLLDRALFLDVSDMSEHMPPLHEIVKLCRPERGEEKTMLHDYNHMLAELKEYGRENGIDLTSIRNQLAMSYLDKPYGACTILDPKSGMDVLEPTDYSYLVENGGLLTKEKLLVDTIRQELSEGRNCVVFAEYTQSEATNILPRLKEIIERECSLKNREVVIMKAGSPQASKREQWMHGKAEDGMKVLLCNPRLCETGLDFCWKEGDTLYNYPTLMFYQSGYSLFVMWQASGRAWRLNQKEECRTFYFGYEGTVQQAILQVLGEKKAATSAIQGRFSADGLAAMAQGVDTQVRIAQIMSEIDTHSVNELQKMFDVISGEKNSAFDDEPAMKLLGELIRIKEEKPEFFSFGTGNLFGGFGLFSAEDKAAEDKKKGQGGQELFSVLSQFNTFLLNIEETPFTGEPEKPVKKKRKKKNTYEGSISIFDYL